MFLTGPLYFLEPLTGLHRPKLFIRSIQEAASGAHTSVSRTVPLPVRGSQTTGVGRSDNDVLHVSPGERRASDRGERECEVEGVWDWRGVSQLGGGSLGLQSQSDDTSSHGGREGGARLRAGAAAIGAQGHLSGRRYT